MGTKMGNKTSSPALDTPTISQLHERYLRENEEGYQHIIRTYELFSKQGSNLLDFSQVDKLIRHLLINFGMLTYLSRFMHEESKTLNWSITEKLGNCAITPKAMYTKSDFMDASLVWLYVLDFVRETDTLNMVQFNREAHEEEHRKYTNAVQVYYDNYREQMTLYREAARKQRDEIKQQQVLAVNAKREIFDIADFNDKDGGGQYEGEAHQNIYDFYKDIIMANTDESKLNNSVCYKAEQSVQGIPLSFGSPMPFT